MSPAGRLAREQAKVGTMEAGAEQFVDCALEIFTGLKNADRFWNTPKLLVDQHGRSPVSLGSPLLR